MSGLKRQIKCTERNLQLNNAYIQKQTASLRKRFNTMSLFLFSLGAFIVGYVVARKKTLKQVIRQFILIPLKWNQLIVSIQKLIARG